MAYTEKNIVITPNKGSSIADPQITFTGADAEISRSIVLSINPEQNGTLDFGTAQSSLVKIRANVEGTVLEVTGAVGASSFSGNHFGNGSGLSSLAGANVIGTVANATYALSAGSATTAGTVTTAAQPNITSVGTLSSLAVSGNANAANFNGNHFGNGSGLSSITGANVTGTVPSATTATTATSATTAGTVTTAAQPNITSVGTLSSLAVTGNANAANFNGNHFGSGAGLSSITGANVTGTVSSATTATSATTAGTVTTAAQPNITSVGTLSSLAVTGNVAAGNFMGILANGISNISIPAQNGNINLYSVGNIWLSAGNAARQFVFNNSLMLFYSAGTLDGRIGGGAGSFTVDAHGTNASPSNLTLSTIYQGSIRFTTDTTERMRILSTGNVGIGTSSPTANLHVIGNANVTGSATLGNSVTANYYYGNGAFLTGISGGASGNLAVVARSGTVNVPTTSGILTVVGRSGNISVALS